MIGGAVVLEGWLALILSILGGIAGLLGVVGTVSAARAVAAQASLRAALEATKDTVATIAAANAELRAANDDLRGQLGEERERRANLEGRLEAMTTHLAQQLVDAVIRTVREVRPAADRTPDTRTRASDRLEVSL